MNTYHLQTMHTWDSVRSGRTMDWERQPEVFKEYPPGFEVVSLDTCTQLRKFLHYCCGLTAEKVYPGGRYFLRANPSAGALYPCELYVQSRAEPGLVDGIYHFEPLSETLRLLHNLEPDEGVEAYFDTGCLVNGLVLLVTAVYYRSSWKYSHRALRYCLLDSGHILGAMEAAAGCTDRPCFFVTRFDRGRVQKDFGFTTRELPMAMGVCGTRQSAEVCCPRMSLPYINGSGSFSRDLIIEQAFLQASVLSACDGDSHAEKPYSASSQALASVVSRRRSIREFSRRPITRAQYMAVYKVLNTDISIDCNENVRIFSIVNRVETMQPGLYADDYCLRNGEFSGMAGHLCLEQSLGADSGVTFFLVGDSDNYLALMLKAGLLGQRIYLESGLQGLGCSGIGAFYDQEVVDFLETDSMILYALAIGI